MRCTIELVRNCKSVGCNQTSNSIDDCAVLVGAGAAGSCEPTNITRVKRFHSHLQPMPPFISPLTTVRALLAGLALCASLVVAAQAQAPQEPPRLSPEQREQLWHTLTPEQRQQFWQGMTPEQRLQLWRSLTPEQRKAIRDRLTPEQREQIRQRLLEHRARANEKGRGAGPRLTPDERKALREQIDEANRDLEREHNGNERRDARPPRTPQERRK